jgi:phage terminase small subunit
MGAIRSLANERLQPANGRAFTRGYTGNFRFFTTTEIFLTKTTDATLSPPKHLSKESAEFFRKSVDAYDLDDHHLLLLTKAMEAQDLAEKCRKILDKEGLTYTDRFGAPRARPEAKIFNDSRNAVKNIFRELGFDLADDNNSRPPLIAGRYK